VDGNELRPHDGASFLAPCSVNVNIGACRDVYHRSPYAGSAFDVQAICVYPFFWNEPWGPRYRGGWGVYHCRDVTIVLVCVGDRMGLLKVGEWLRKCIWIFPWFVGMRSLVGGVVLRGGIGKRGYPVEDIKVSALAQDMNALAG